MHCDEYRSAMGKVSASPELKAKLVAAMEAEETAPRAKTRRFPVRAGLTAAAAAAVLALAAPVFLGRTGGASLSTNGTAQQYAAAAAPEETQDVAPQMAFDAAPEAQGRMNQSEATAALADAPADALGNPTPDLAADELPGALPLLEPDTSGLENDVRNLTDALGLTLTVTQQEDSWLSGEAVAGGAVYAVWAGSSGIELSLTSEAGLAYEDASGALAQWSASRGNGGETHSAENESADGAREVRLWTGEDSGAAASLLAYTRTAVTATLAQDGTVLSLSAAPRLTEGTELALRSEDEAREEALAEGGDGAEVRRALCYADDGSGALVPHYLFFFSSETGGETSVLVSAVQQ